MIFLETILTFIKQTIGSEMLIQLVKHYPLDNHATAMSAMLQRGRELHVRFLNLFRTCLNSNNLCAKLVLQGNRSDAAKSVHSSCSFNKHDIANAQRNDY